MSGMWLKCHVCKQKHKCLADMYGDTKLPCYSTAWSIYKWFMRVLCIVPPVWLFGLSGTYLANSPHIEGKTTPLEGFATIYIVSTGVCVVLVIIKAWIRVQNKFERAGGRIFPFKMEVD